MLEEHREELRELVVRPVQTNEVGCSAALLGGFLLVARETGMPLRVLELGASAGLNLLWDRYRYEADGVGWGDPASPVRIADPFVEGSLPPLEVPACVVERGGCDLRPLDPASEDGRLTRCSRTCGPTTAGASGCSGTRSLWRPGFRSGWRRPPLPTGSRRGWGR
jgi:hypothetical protein